MLGEWHLVMYFRSSVLPGYLHCDDSLDILEDFVFDGIELGKVLPVERLPEGVDVRKVRRGNVLVALNSLEDAVETR